MITKKNVNHDKIITPIISKCSIKPFKIKNIRELQNDLKHKIYTNIYSYNTIYQGVFTCRGVNIITGTKNSGKTSLSSHISVNLFFNDLLHFFHLFYSAYFSFENFLKRQNLENKPSKVLGENVGKIRKGFIDNNDSFCKLNELIEYFTFLFVEKYEKREKGSSDISNIHIRSVDNKKVNRNSEFSKKKVIYIDLDSSFYNERYKNMIYSSIDRIKKLLNTYIEFCSEKNSILFLLLLENKELKQNLFYTYKNYSEDNFLFINLFNKYLKKYINDITFLEVFNNLQILKIFSFNELTIVIDYIYEQVLKYSTIPNNHFNVHVSSDIGILVIDNLNYLCKSDIPSSDLSQLVSLLNILSKLSTEHKICVLITNNDNKYLTKYDGYFNKVCSRYVYNRIVLNFINKKDYFEYNYQEKKQIKFQDKTDANASSEESFNELGEYDDEDFYEKRYNLRCIKIKKKNKVNLCFFEINKFGIQTLVE